MLSMSETWKITVNVGFMFSSGIQVRVVPRPSSQLLGTNGRDDGPVVSSLLVHLNQQKYVYHLSLVILKLSVAFLGNLIQL